MEIRRQQQIIACCCAKAASRGVRLGMTLAHARSLLGGQTVLVHPHEPAGDAAALHGLAQWTVRFSPRAAAHQPDCVLIDVTGCERLYKSEPRLICDVLRALQRLQLNPRAAIAPTVGSAWAFAQCSDIMPVIVSCEELRARLGVLPVHALRLEDAVVNELAEVGIQRIEQLLHVPRHELAARFHHLVLRRVDQALGRVEEVIEPVRALSLPVVEQCFAGPTTSLEAIEITVRRLLEALSIVLLRREQGAQQLEIAIDRYDIELHLETHREAVTLSRPSRDAKHLWALLRPHVERMHLGRGIERVELKAARVKRLPHEQTAWAGGAHDVIHINEAAGQLIDLLQTRLGERAVQRAEIIDTHVPEACVRLQPAKESAMIAQRQVRAGQRVDIYQREATALPRPAQLLSPPEPVRVTMLQPEGPLLSVQWRKAHRITHSIGPERIDQRWWRFRWSSSLPASRDYYRAQDDTGRWLWLYRCRSSGKWFVHGMW